MSDISILIGGEAGFGIDRASLIIAKILNKLGYNTYIYREYPSTIRGGHTYSIVRASKEKITAIRDKIDFLLCLNQDTYDIHKNLLKKDSVVIYDSNIIKADGIGVDISKITQEAKGIPLMRNTCMIGAFCKAAKIDKKILEEVLGKNIPKDKDINLLVAFNGFDKSKETFEIKKVSDNTYPILTGNDAISLGFLSAGMESYIAYPMTPASSILHFFAKNARKFNLKVVHAENEITVIMLALGIASAGNRVAIGTSGGGFCLMTEGVSFSAMAELPIAIVLAQRTGPSTGLPTYTAQTELNFALYTGHGEFLRLVVAPGDAEEAYYYSALALNISWKYQIPSIILTDKILSEGTYSFEKPNEEETKKMQELLWDKKGSYKRYQETENGVSPLSYYSQNDAIIKITSYEHDEYGITTEDANETIKMQNKRLNKEKYLIEELKKYKTIKVFGNTKSNTALICWGSNKGLCIEVAKELNIKVIIPYVMAPFMKEEFKKAIKDTTKSICIEDNSYGQLANLLKLNDYLVTDKILKYDGRPFTIENLLKEVKSKLNG
jgi:2-oxoglutarate ferredoxin oxidoreductase subunit alpha